MSNANLVKHGDRGWQEEKKMEEKNVESLHAVDEWRLYVRGSCGLLPAPPPRSPHDRRFLPDLLAS